MAKGRRWPLRQALMGAGPQHRTDPSQGQGGPQTLPRGLRSRRGPQAPTGHRARDETLWFPEPGPPRRPPSHGGHRPHRAWRAPGPPSLGQGLSEGASAGAAGGL